MEGRTSSRHVGNQGILDHEKKRKIEVKCAELEDLLVDQNLAEEEIVEKVTAYRKMLMQSVDINDKIELDDFGRPIIKATDSHQIAKMQNERNEKLKDAFGIMSQAQKDEEEPHPSPHDSCGEDVVKWMAPVPEMFELPRPPKGEPCDPGTGRRREGARHDRGDLLRSPKVLPQP